ncbi:MAG: cytochrome c nitrite reductase small subunit [Gemmatimonadota bacterium]
MRTGWLLLAIAVLIGIGVGLGGWTFVYAKGYSYLTDNPESCANCHIMDDHFDAWQKSSHKAVAGCNDCHTPHDNVMDKYYVKATNGFLHSLYFTTGDFPYPIRIRDPNHEVVEQSCRYCHETIAATIDHGLPEGIDGAAKQDCTHCHRYVGHWVR